MHNALKRPDGPKGGVEPRRPQEKNQQENMKYKKINHHQKDEKNKKQENKKFKNTQTRGGGGRASGLLFARDLFSCTRVRRACV